MSDPRPPRRPGAYRLEETGTAPLEQAAPPEMRSPRAVDDLALLALDAEDAIEREDGIADLEAADMPPAEKRFSFLKLLVAALGALVSIGVGLMLDGLVRDLFQRSDWLGWTGVALAALLVVALLGIVIRELSGLAKLAAVDRERKAAQAAYDSDSSKEAETVVAGLVALVSAKAETAEGRARLADLKGEVIDGRDWIALAEREILSPLDMKARALVLGSAKRVSVVTAVSPRALVDVGYVLFETVRLIRAMSELYGARPGTIGLMKLVRDVLGHLAVTGSISIGDNILGQVVGHGLAARVSARLGEGVVNGLLTARVGLAAMDLCRPMPFIRLRRPRIGDFISDLTALPGDGGKPRRGA